MYFNLVQQPTNEIEIKLNDNLINYVTYTTFVGFDIPLNVECTLKKLFNELPSLCFLLRKVTKSKSTNDEEVREMIMNQSKKSLIMLANIYNHFSQFILHMYVNE